MLIYVMYVLHASYDDRLSLLSRCFFMVNIECSTITNIKSKVSDGGDRHLTVKYQITATFGVLLLKIKNDEVHQSFLSILFLALHIHSSLPDIFLGIKSLTL